MQYSGKNRPFWLNGEFSYRNILIKKKQKRKCWLCGTANFKILAVHHIDKNRKNNNLNNLSWLCHNCHFLVHHYEEEKNKFSNIVQKNI